MSDYKHTPTPWSANRFAEVTAHDGVICETGGSDYTQPRDDANAAFIVLAVNHHEQLMAALASILWEDSSKPEQDRITDRVVASAIYASARGESQ